MASKTLANPPKPRKFTLAALGRLRDLFHGVEGLNGGTGTSRVFRRFSVHILISDKHSTATS